jgi:hypothetical protein
LNCFSISSSFNFFTYIIFGLILFIVLYPYLDLFYFSISSLVILFYLVFISYLVLIFFIAIYYYYFLDLFFNFIPHCFISFNFYIRFGPHSIDCYVCLFFFFFGWLRILLHDFFEFVFYGVTRVMGFEN